MKVDFQLILDDDEQVIKTFKPNKLRFYFTNMLIFFAIWIPIFLIATFAFFFPDDSGYSMPGYVFLILLGAMVLFFLIDLFFLVLAYKKREYAYTNKRVLIQDGIIGTDYKGLDHKMIGATEVRVDLLDKVLGQNTGTLRFGSMASPMNQQAINMFTFRGIKDPYSVYKEIKKYIDTTKE